MSVRSKNEFSQSWPVLAAATLGLAVGVNAIPFYTAGTFMVPLGKEFGWSRSQLSLGPTFLTLVLAFTAPLIGAIIDRFGERVVVAISLVGAALTFASFSFFNGNISLYWISFAALALIGGGAATVAFSRVVSRTFIVHRGAALGIALTGTGLTSTVAPYLVSTLIAQIGWRETYLVLGAVMGLALPIILIGLSLGRGRRADPAPVLNSRAPAEALAETPDLNVLDALRTTTFWRMAVAFPLVGLAAIGLAVHIFPMLTDIGLSAARAGAIAGVVGLSMILARVTSGVLFDYFFAPRVGAVVVAIASLGMLLVATGNPAFGWCGAIAVGLCIGVEFDMMAFMTAKYFGVGSFGKIYGVLYLVTTIGTATSAFAYGEWADRAGSYVPALYTASALLAVVVAVLWTMPAFPVGCLEGRRSKKWQWSRLRRATATNGGDGR